jgi:hypothetical protein
VEAHTSLEKNHITAMKQKAPPKLLPLASSTIGAISTFQMESAKQCNDELFKKT